MNRIILIGNGFDLAHGLETSYKSFIENLWINKLGRFKSDVTLKGKDNEIELNNISHYGYYLPNLISNYQDLIDYNKERKDGKLNIVYKNIFLKLITDKKYLTNWVDVENEYFSELLFISKNNIEKEIKKLNGDFLAIKNLLEKHLLEEINLKQNSLGRKDEIFSKIYSNFNVEDFSKVGLEFLYKELHTKLDLFIENNKIPGFTDELEDVYNFVIRNNMEGKPILNEDKLKKLFQNHELAKHYLQIKPSNCLFLNFNYTNVETYYSQYFKSAYSDYQPKIEINHIHGELNSKTNPIIFGYGDEIGKDYAVIEEINNNELLENVKSIRYLDTDNYKKLLEYIDSEKYQIFVMGHSCGNSDRTLLNTLFEHKNCISIKVFYHQINENEDNYSDVIRNISRNFNDKKMMREKVVNKMYCMPMVTKN
jgi:hypothetical protein